MRVCKIDELLDREVEGVICRWQVMEKDCDDFSLSPLAAD